MEFDFVSRRPGPPLERFVESVWYARGQIDYPRERIAPTGSTVAVIVLGSPIREIPNDGRGEPFVATAGFLLGPHDRPVVNEPLGETYCVGVVSTPVGCRALFGVAPAPLRGRVVDLVAAWPPAGRLREALLGTADPGEMLELAEAALAAGLRVGEPAVDRCEAAVRALAADPIRGIGLLAAELGVSHGHLDREFVATVGLSPRALSRILRLRAALAGVDVYAPTNWARVAAELGWFDQSHFIRDFRRHTGWLPRSTWLPSGAASPRSRRLPGSSPRREIRTRLPGVVRPTVVGAVATVDREYE